jgi:hypothetical protein
MKVAFRIMLATATVKLLPFCGAFKTILGGFVDVPEDAPKPLYEENRKKSIAIIRKIDIADAKIFLRVKKLF